MGDLGIKNDLELRITKSWKEKFELAFEDCKKRKYPHPLLAKLEMDAIKSQIDGLTLAIAVFEMCVPESCLTIKESKEGSAGLSEIIRAIAPELYLRPIGNLPVGGEGSCVSENGAFIVTPIQIAREI